MKIGKYSHTTGKGSLKSKEDENGIKRIVPHGGRSRDNGQNKIYKEKGSINWSRKKSLNLSRIYKESMDEEFDSRSISEHALIQQGLDDYYDGPLEEDIPFYYEHFLGFNESIFGVLDKNEVITEISLDYFNIDDVNENDKEKMRLLIENRVVSIEDNGINISESTLIYIRNRRGIIKSEISLGKLLEYMGFVSKDFRKSLNKFIDNNRIIDIDVNIKNPNKDASNILPIELKGHSSSPTYNNSKKAA